MCVPISVLTKGKISGCTGVCGLWPHISALMVLGGGLVWNFAHGKSSMKEEVGPSGEEEAKF